MVIRLAVGEVSFTDDPLLRPRSMLYPSPSGYTMFSAKRSMSLTTSGSLDTSSPASILAIVSTTSVGVKSFLAVNEQDIFIGLP